MKQNFTGSFSTYTPYDKPCTSLLETIVYPLKACSLPKPHDTIVNIANTRFQQATALRAVQYVVE